MESTALVTLTPLAVTKVKEVMAEQGEPEAALRVLMVPAGEGVQYMLSLEQEPTDEDVSVEQDGVRILVDRDSAPLLEGTSIDYLDGLMRSGFVINNPNIVASGGCGCGGDGCGCGGGECGCGGH